MERIRVELVGGRRLDELTEVHHADPRAHVLHDRQVVGNEEIADTQTVLDLSQEVHHLGADRHVERRDRLVEQDALRIRRQGPGDRDALALSS